MVAVELVAERIGGAADGGGIGGTVAPMDDRGEGCFSGAEGVGERAGDTEAGDGPFGCVGRTHVGRADGQGQWRDRAGGGVERVAVVVAAVAVVDDAAGR